MKKEYEEDVRKYLTDCEFYCVEGGGHSLQTKFAGHFLANIIPFLTK